MRKRSVFWKRILPVFMVGVLSFTSVPANIRSKLTGSEAMNMSTVSATGVNSEEDYLTVSASGSSAGSDYGLADSVEDGVILHAWNWSFKQIQEELPKIAAAGFTAIQTSPAQANKDGNSISESNKWWKFYQPTDFTIGNKLGTKEELTELCAEADKYGIKIIVDVVANHLANVTGKEGNAASDRSSQIPSWIRENDDFWHSDNYSKSSDSDRKQMTRAPIGMPDLNTGNKELQDYIIKYLNDLQDCGVDGFRFDAAKHIETPDDDSSFASQFWERVARKTKAKDPNVFLYGEILNSAGPGNYNDIKKYTKYIKVTNNLYGNNVQSSVDKWDASKAKDLTGRNSSGTNIFGSNGNEWVLWNESHDTFAGGKTDGYSNEQMVMAWCAVAARYSTALYFVRPSGGSDWKSSELGSHEMAYTSKRIAAMNKFHNYFAGKSEYASTSDNVLVVERSTSGVALINYNQGSRKVSIQMHRMKDGIYTDQLTGNVFTVSNGILTGTIGEKGVAAIYNPVPPVGTQLTDNKAIYKVTDNNNNVPVVAYVKAADPSAKQVTVPATVTIDGVTYKVTAIAKNAFKNNKKITKIVIGNNIVTIGAGAFLGCTKLKKIVIGKNVTTIGTKAFYKCTKLKSIIIPAKVKNIGKSAFFGCKNLRKITINTKLLTKKSVGKNAFKGIHAKAGIKVPKNKHKAYKKLLLNKGVGPKGKITKKAK
ncbi:MAG: leucine-rich repeat protein [Clostridiales bacterium]|nr:leucine-rich repeat protein [Clostridiales bacterium]